MSMVLFIAALALASAQIVPNEFVATFKDEVDASAIQAHMALVSASGSRVLFEYDFGGFRGYSVRVPETATKNTRAFLNAPELSLVEPNMIVRASRPVSNASRVQASAECNVQQEATWGLVRVSERSLNIDGMCDFFDLKLGCFPLLAWF
jgi:hypothetical protein